MKKQFSICCILLAVSYQSVADSWVPKASMNLGRATAFAFTIGTKGYVGGGTNYSQAPAFLKDFWQYNPSTDSWTQRADFGGGNRTAAVAFSVDGYGYALTGADVNANRRSDMWRYDTLSNSWTQMTHLTGLARNYSVAFSIGNKGYIGTGTDTLGNQTNDFWQYNPISNSWTQKANFSGAPRETAVGFGIGGKGYIGTGYVAGPTNDFYAYDTLANAWSPIANCGTTLRESATAFVINGKGYVCTGNVSSVVTNDLLEYTPSSNSWASKTSKPGSGKSNGAAFAVGGKGYMVSGYDSGFNQTSDMYQYTPDVSTDVNERTNDYGELSLYPNPTSGELRIADFGLRIEGVKILNVFGEYVLNQQLSAIYYQLTLDVSALAKGVYFVQITDENKNIVNRKIVIE